MRTIILMHQTVTNHDAIGNDIEGMYRLLSEKNACYVYAVYQLNTKVTYISMDELEKVIKTPETVVIYHHSGFWEQGEAVLDACMCKIVIRYHNITPPEFFKPYSELHYSQCKYGREQTERFIKKYSRAIWLSDSAYNQGEIHDIPEERLSICPPFHKIDKWRTKQPSERVLQELLYDDCLQVLFVGRIAPNKGHLFMLEVLSCYCENYDTSIVLRIVGRQDDLLKGYNEEIKQHIRCHELEGNVKFIGEVTDSALLAYYHGSDVFLCVSEHEGFCVPLLEAQSCGLPILARKLCAVPDTLGEQQLLLEEDVREYAAALHELKQNQELVDYVRKQGKRNYKTQYINEVITKRFVEFIREKVEVSII
ncbi:MAG: glycosyltransferase family 4 protein [Bacteroides sp.]|nr:glycosyltransferase family 4 protein [Bacteroides sp.]MCM1548410.1 glycosyltransferase family 4 protein [Clostridium sp.]